MLPIGFLRSFGSSLADSKQAWELMAIKVDIPALETLAQVVRDFLGIWIEPAKIRRLAEAQAYKIQLLSQAVTNARFEGTDIKYDREGVFLVPSSEVEAIAQTLPERAIKGESISLLREQLNRERIVGYAAQALSSESRAENEKAQEATNEKYDEPTAEPPDVDWLHAFFESAKFVNREEMQKLWGQILAQEIQSPGNFSIRLLFFLKSLSNADASRIEQTIKYALNGLFIPSIFTAFLEMDDIYLLQELNLLQSTGPFVNERLFEEPFALHRKIESHWQGILCKPSSKYHLGVFLLTSIGRELNSLVSKAPTPVDWIRMGGLLKKDGGFPVAYVNVQAKRDGQLLCNTIQNI